MKKKKKSLALIKFLSFLVVFLALVQVFISYRLATAGKLVAELESQAAELRTENDQLREVINQEGSLLAVLKKAESLGFKSIEKIVYLTSEVPVALGR
jgi:cell division protein FtsL